MFFLKAYTDQESRLSLGFFQVNKAMRNTDFRKLSPHSAVLFGDGLS
jgi:hypothetical protein